jgi:hypothetical protein
MEKKPATENQEEFFDAVSSPPDSPKAAKQPQEGMFAPDTGGSEDLYGGETIPQAQEVATNSTENPKNFEKAVELKAAGNNFFKEGKFAEVKKRLIQS